MPDLTPTEGEVMPTLKDCVDKFNRGKEHAQGGAYLMAEACFECLSQGLWREGYESFGDFCEKALGLAKSQGSRLAAAYEVHRALNSPVGEFKERRLRPLTALKLSAGRNWRPIDDKEKGLVKKAYERAVKEAGDSEPTEQHINLGARYVASKNARINSASKEILGIRKRPESVAVGRDLERAAAVLVGFYGPEIQRLVQLIREEIEDGE